MPAACFLRPSNTVEVALALKIVTLTQSKFAIRSGGHNPNPGFASVDNSGVLLDLSKLDTLELANGREIIRVGAGNRWGDVQNYLDPYSKTAVGGMDLHVGVPGVILGGMY